MGTVCKILSLVLLSAMAFLPGCSSSRDIKMPYDQVSAAALEKFYVNTWSMYDTKKSWRAEKAGKHLKITYYDWSFPDTKIYCVVEIVADKSECAAYVFVKDYDSWLAPMTWSSSDANKVLDLLEKRMSSGAWDPLPWEEKVEERKIRSP